jgi:hypothetical protein
LEETVFENRDYSGRVSVTLTTLHHLSAEVGTNVAESGGLFACKFATK